MFRTLYPSLMLVLFVSVAIATPDHDSPIQPYPNAHIDGSSTKHVEDYRLAIEPIGGEAAISYRSYEGVLKHTRFEIPETESIKNVVTSYVQALKQAGFKMVFRCRKRECGGNLVRGLFEATARQSDYERVEDDVFGEDNTDFFYLAASKVQAGKEIVVVLILRQITISSWPIYLTQDVLELSEAAPVELAVNINFEGLITDGRVVLGGLHFQRDSATIKVESHDALSAVAEYLGKNPEQDFFVVGHTDADGSYEHNLALSQARSASVVSQLTQRYGVPISQLTPVGVGPVSPIANNQGAQTKALNRRVELVLK